MENLNINWFRQIGFQDTLFLSVLFGLLVLLLLSRWWAASQLKASFSHYWIKPLIRAVAISALLIALLGPAFESVKKETETRSKDIMVLLDLSSSMNAQDVSPSRLQAIKFTLKNLIGKLSGDRVGLVIFSNEAFMQCPLTYDKSAFNLHIESVNTNLVPTAGTEFAPALKMAIDKLKLQENQRETAKIALLISDGEDHGEESLEVAEDMKEEGIKLFTLGVGTETGAPVPGEKGYKKDRKGETVITKLNNKKLKKLAREAEGSYFEINESNNETQLLLSAIENERGAVNQKLATDVQANLYRPVLLLAAFLLFLDFVLPLTVVIISNKK